MPPRPRDSTASSIKRQNAASWWFLFDNIVTTPKALKVNTDQVKFGESLADWLAKKLNGKGNVIMVTGVAGTSVDQDRNKGAEKVWSQNPGIKVVSRFTGMWDSSIAERNTAAVLNSLPQIDGIWCQGGTDGVLKALLAANRPLPPTAGEAENGFRKFMIGYDGHKVEGISIGQPPSSRSYRLNSRGAFSTTSIRARTSLFRSHM
jgi:ribose transport system substrate-binding protein